MCGGIGVCPSQRVHGPRRADSETVTVTATEEVVVVVEVQPPRDGDSHNHFEADAKTTPKSSSTPVRSSPALTALGKRPAKGRAPRRATTVPSLVKRGATTSPKHTDTTAVTPALSARPDPDCLNCRRKSGAVVVRSRRVTKAT